MANNANQCIVVAPADIYCSTDEGATWFDAGITTGGVSIRYEPTFQEIEADQVFGIAARPKTNERMFVSFELLCVTLDNIRRAMAQSESSLTTASGQPCLYLGEPLEDCATDITCMLRLVTKGPCCCKRTWEFYCATPSEGWEMNLSKTDAQTLSVTYEMLKITERLTAGGSMNPYFGRFGCICDDCSGVTDGQACYDDIEAAAELPGDPSDKPTPPAFDPNLP